MAQDNPRVSIVILNWNGWRDTVECLESLLGITYPAYDIVLLDNGSSDDSIEKIRTYCAGGLPQTSDFFTYNPRNKPVPVNEYSRPAAESLTAPPQDLRGMPGGTRLVLIRNEKNLGFSEGNNIGIRFALTALDPAYVLLLNNDTTVDPPFLTEMVRVAAQDPMIGFVGSKIYYYDFAGKKDVFNTAGGMQNLGLGRTVLIGCRETDTGQYDTPRTVDFVSGACFLVRTEVLRTVGLLDPRYFAYWEENDLATRGVRAGYITVYAPGAKIWHKISVSTKNSTLKTYLLTRNTFWFERKFATKPQLLTFFLYFFLYQFWESTLYSLVVKRDVQLYRSFLRGLKDGLAPRQDQ